MDRRKGNRKNNPKAGEKQTQDAKPVPSSPPIEAAPEHVEQQPKGDVGDNRPHKQDGPKPPPRNRAIDWMLFFTAVVALSAVTQAVITSCQWTAARDSNAISAAAVDEANKANELNRKAFEIANRSWISFRKAESINNLEQVDITWIHSGNVPANEFRFYTEIIVREGNTLHRKIIHDADKPNAAYITALAPGKTAVESILMKQAFDDATLESIRDGTYRLTIYGEVRYSDIFGKREPARYAVQWDREHGFVQPLGEKRTIDTRQ